jgi:hypothetical protein
VMVMVSRQALAEVLVYIQMVRSVIPDDAQASRSYLDPLEQARIFYLAVYEDEGSRWESNEYKDVWVHKARDYERRRRELAPLAEPQRSLGREVAKLMDKHGLGPAKPQFWLDLEAIAEPQAAVEPQTLGGMIAAIYGNLDAEDCARIDREWLKFRNPNIQTQAAPDDPDAGAWNALIDAKERAEAELQQLLEVPPQATETFAILHLRGALDDIAVGAYNTASCRIETAIAVLAAPPQAAWRAIETAPRDGTRIIAMGGGLGNEMEIISYNQSVGAWNTPNFTLDDRDDEAEGYNRPTKWQPLPEINSLSRPLRQVTDGDGK